NCGLEVTMPNAARKHSSLHSTAKKRQASAARSHMTAHQRGYTGKWRREADGYLAQHPWCGHCRMIGNRTRATEVDHINPHRGNMTLFWDRTSWQGLCKHRHAVKTGRGQWPPHRHPLSR